VEKLNEEARTVRVRGVRHAAKRRDDLVPVAGKRVRRQQAGWVNGGSLEHDQPDSTVCSGLVVCDEIVSRDVVDDEVRLVCRGDDPVRQLGRPEFERAEETLKHPPR
jgi:hypothetical protein